MNNNTEKLVKKTCSGAQITRRRTVFVQDQYCKYIDAFCVDKLG